MQRFLTSVLTLVLAGSLVAGASAKPCRDAHGKFMKCKPAPMAMGHKCRDKHGKFMKCPPMHMGHM
jgi:hypothetical protein